MSERPTPEWVTSWPDWLGPEFEHQNVTVVPKSDYDHERERSTGLEGDRIELQAKCGALQQRIMELTRERDEARAALRDAVEHVRAWHGMGVPRHEEPALWGIYWNNAPET